jgi:hypothetical protein
MSIFYEETQPITSLDTHVETIKKRNTNLLESVKVVHKVLWDKIWNSEFDTQTILDQFGSDAYKLFELSVDLQTLMAKADPNYVPLVAPKEFTANEDGTITIIEPTPEPTPDE